MWAYGWAFVDPNRKLGYNIFGAPVHYWTAGQTCVPADMLSARAVTLTSALIALVIASVESLAVLASAMQWKGSFWTLMINAPFEVLGYLIIGGSTRLRPPAAAFSVRLPCRLCLLTACIAFTCWQVCLSLG